MLFTNKATNWGCTYEKQARERYVTQMKIKHPTFLVSSCGLLINPQYPYLGASPDGLVSCECCGDGCIEIKCPCCLRKEEHSLKDHKCLQYADSEITLSSSHAYYYQVQCQISVSNRSYCYFVLWKTNEILIKKIYRDEQFWENAIEKAEAFFQKVILPEMMGKLFTQSCLPDGKKE